MARFCTHCGHELNENAVVCVNCGCAVAQAGSYDNNQMRNSSEKPSYASLILGIIGIVFAWVFALIGHVISIVGIVLGAKEKKRTGRSAGLTVSIVGEVCAVINSIIGVILSVELF